MSAKKGPKKKLTKGTIAAIISAVLLIVIGVGSLIAANAMLVEKKDMPEVTIGTLATEDILPVWAAEKDGYFDNVNLKVNVVTFQSAAELIAGVTSGEVDYAMTDPMVAASIFASGTNVKIEWVTLGKEASQGRFGIMTSAKTGITDVSQLAGKTIAVGSNTMLEYVMENLLADAGINADQFKKEEIQKLSVRYQSMAAGQVDAAVLPASLLALGEANGCICIVDDTEGNNLSQSVMISRTDFLEKEGGADTLNALKTVWNTAAKAINNNNSAYLPLLIEKGAVSDTLAETYKVSNYPEADLPKASIVNSMLEWMIAKNYLTASVSYNGDTGEFFINQ